MKYMKAIHEGTECIGRSQKRFQSRSEFLAESRAGIMRQLFFFWRIGAFLHPV